MKITRSRTHKFSMAPYEQLELSATVELDTEELPENEDAVDAANRLLDEVLQPDLQRADDSSQTPQDDTYLHAWKDNI